MDKADVIGTLQIKLPINDAPNVQLPIGHIKMAPPAYAVGDKVFAYVVSRVYTLLADYFNVILIHLEEKNDE